MCMTNHVYTMTQLCNFPLLHTCNTHTHPSLCRHIHTHTHTYTHTYAYIGGERKFNLGGGLTCITINYQAHSSKRVSYWAQILGGGGGGGGGLQPQSPMGSSAYDMYRYTHLS